MFSGALSGLAKMRMQRNPVDVQIAKRIQQAQQAQCWEEGLAILQEVPWLQDVASIESYIYF